MEKKVVLLMKGLKGGDAGKLKNNKAVRDYAHNKYKHFGLKEKDITPLKI